MCVHLIANKSRLFHFENWSVWWHRAIVGDLCTSLNILMLTRSAGDEEREKVALDSVNGLENIAKSFINTKENEFLSHRCVCAMCCAVKLTRINITFSHEKKTNNKRITLSSLLTTPIARCFQWNEPIIAPGNPHSTTFFQLCFVYFALNLHSFASNK